jgi:hypothetical protein
VHTFFGGANPSYCLEPYIHVIVLQATVVYKQPSK